MFIKQKELELGQEFPAYFRNVWKQQIGIDLFRRQVLCTKLLTVSLVAGLLGIAAIIALLWQSFHNPVGSAFPPFMSWQQLAVVGTAMVAMIGTLIVISLSESMGQFKGKLSELATLLSRTVEELGQLEIADLRAISVADLKKLAACVKAVETVTGGEPHVAKVAVKRLLKDRYEIYAWWGVIPRDGVKPYFES